MARPKRPYNGVEDINAVTDRWRQRVGTKQLGTRVKGRWDASRNWSYRATNGIYDPLTYLMVLDTLVGIDADIELRTYNLVPWLNQFKKQFAWDTITVGKVLADICEHFEDILGAKNGLLERGKDYKGNFYRIHINPETVDLFYEARQELMDLAEAEMEARARGNRTQRLVSPLLEVKSLRAEFEEVG